jgi:hypothetical protein
MIYLPHLLHIYFHENSPNAYLDEGDAEFNLSMAAVFYAFVHAFVLVGAHGNMTHCNVSRQSSGR